MSKCSPNRVKKLRQLGLTESQILSSKMLCNNWSFHILSNQSRSMLLCVRRINILSFLTVTGLFPFSIPGNVTLFLLPFTSVGLINRTFRTACLHQLSVRQTLDVPFQRYVSSEAASCLSKILEYILILLVVRRLPPRCLSEAEKSCFLKIVLFQIGSTLL